MPDVPNNWRSAFFRVERRLSPHLEAVMRTGGALDTVAVVSGMSRLATRTVRRVGGAVLEGVGLPSGRQVAQLQRSIDSLNRTGPQWQR
jgi:hypothetical protein